MHIYIPKDRVCVLHRNEKVTQTEMQTMLKEVKGPACMPRCMHGVATRRQRLNTLNKRTIHSTTATKIVTAAQKFVTTVQTGRAATAFLLYFHCKIIYRGVYPISAPLAQVRASLAQASVLDLNHKLLESHMHVQCHGASNIARLQE